MKRKTVFFVSALVVLLFVCSFFVGADHSIFINDGASRLRGLFSENYAIGGSGIEPLAFDDVYVLTARGTSTIGSTGAEGGGGLLYDNGSVKIKSDIIKVGLSFNFNRADSDTTVQQAIFTNTEGGGFSFGYFDNARSFVQLDTTSESTVYAAALEPDSLYLGVYDSAGNLLYQTKNPNTKDNMIAIMPESDSADVLTRYDGNRYYGAFEAGYTAGSGITVINTLPLEQYLKGVITAEMVGGAPIEAYKAQAVAARSYAQRCIKNTDLYDYYGFDVTNNTYYQAYYGYFLPSGVNYSTICSAVGETENEYLTYNGSVIDALFCAANGGETVDGGYPYLKSFEDPYEAKAWTKGIFGHGMGMSQWGAYSMAKYYNKDYKAILGFYYTKVGISYGYQ